MKYNQEEKIKLVTRYHEGESVTSICHQSNIPRSTFYSWIKSYKNKVTNSGHNINSAEFIKMKNKIERLEQIIEILKKVNCTVSSPLQVKLNELELLHGQYNVHVLCESLNVSRGTFYNHIFRNKKENKSYQFRRVELSEQIRQIYEENKQIYGAKKIKAVLSSRGVPISEKMVSELMNEMNLFSIRTDAKKIYVKRNKENKAKKNDYLKMNFSSKAPNKIWVSDITYYKFKGIFYYIAVIIDLYSRKVISYKISRKNSAHLITSTFKEAYNTRNPQTELIFHSDRGSQYTSNTFKNLLKSYNVNQSFSPSGKPTHNAVIESFFSSIKKEELYRKDYSSQEEFKKGVNAYIDFYNNKRPHSTLGYKTPNVYDQMFFEIQQSRKNLDNRVQKP